MKHACQQFRVKVGPVMEVALAHTNPDKTEAAYARSDLFERQRTLMDQWATYLTQADDKIVPLMRRG